MKNVPRECTTLRSPMTSRSNCAKDNRTFRVKRPIEVVVLNCCVTDTKDAPLASRAGRVHRRAGESAVMISRPQADPAFVPLAVDEGLAGFALLAQILLQQCLVRRRGLIVARARLPRPKNRGPDQCAPVIRSAITVSDR